LTRDSRILGLELEVKNDRTEAESESFDNRICCEVGDGALVGDSETMEPESETDNNNSESESERSRDEVCHQVENSSKDSEALILELGSDNDKLGIDSEHSGYREHCSGVWSPFRLMFLLPEMIVDRDSCRI